MFEISKSYPQIVLLGSIPLVIFVLSEYGMHHEQT